MYCKLFVYYPDEDLVAFYLESVRLAEIKKKFALDEFREPSLDWCKTNEFGHLSASHSLWVRKCWREMGYGQVMFTTFILDFYLFSHEILNKTTRVDRPLQSVNINK